MKKAPLQPSVYLAIDTDGTVYVIAHRSEMGNGVRTSLPRIVADELDADWARVKVVQATGDEKYGDQDTDGSHSVVSFFIPLREAGATARLMMVRAAAQQWNVPATECSTELHTVVHKSFGKEIGLRRARRSGVETGSAEEGRIETEAAKRVALHREGCGELRFEGFVHRQRRLRAGRAHGWDVVRERDAPAGAGQLAEIDRQQGDAGRCGSEADGNDRHVQAARWFIRR